ncbi:MAG: VOC family protein [Planctomycetes bacterium]|nr:VOC family protein [Planctomycetota bacterium]
MHANQGPWPGRFVWHDLMTKNAKASQDFYCAMFDWQIQEIPMGPCTYRMITCGPGPIGGIVEEQNIPAPHWMPYLAVDDVDAKAKLAGTIGGTCCVPPTDIPQTGRFAVLGDPTGGYFSIYKGLPESQGFDPDVPVPGRICWNELLTTDPAKAVAFYRKLVGWKTQDKDMGPMGTYHLQLNGDKQAGGIMKSPQPDMSSAWLCYFFTTDLEGSHGKAKKLGATELVPPSPIPGIGRFSMLLDPTGAAFALFSM